MVRLTATAQDQLHDLEDHYVRLDRISAIIRLTEALAMAAIRIEEDQGPFFSAPRPYPDLASYGWLWLKEHRYWIAFEAVADDFIVTAIFHESADIPGRI